MITLRQQLVISRSQLPLSFLDPDPLEVAQRFHTSFIAELELELDEGLGAIPRVVLASIGDVLPLLAIERVQRGVYALCRLLRTVTLQDFQSSVSAVQAFTPITATTTKVAEDDRWWAAASLAAALPVSLESGVEITQPQHVSAAAFSNNTTDVTTCLSTPAPQEMETHAVDPAEAYAAFVQQYLDTLYLSKTPLSYLVKGPVSRLRAAFTSPAHNLDLLDKLNSMVLSFTTLDKKYKHELPAVLKALVTDEVKHHGESDPLIKTKSHRKSGKIKLGKNGLYKHEELVVGQYWSRDTMESTQDLPQHQLTRDLQRLQTREELMQLIIILEILSLEEHISAPDQNAIGDHGSQPTKLQQENTSDGAEKRKKKGFNAKTHLDSMVDRLCIRQSVQIESDATKTQDFGSDQDRRKDSGASSDYLKDFFAEVMIPLCVSHGKSRGA